MKKMLLAVGCSFTDKNFKSLHYPEYDCSFPKWPEIVGDRLDMVVLNEAQCGYGNDQIANIVIDKLLNNFENIDTVMIGWSEIWRFSPYDYYRINPMAERKVHADNLTSNALKENLTDKIWLDILKYKHDALYHIIKNFYKQILRVQKICELFNVKLIQHHLCGSLEMHRFNYAAKMYDTTWDYSKVEWGYLLSTTPGFYHIDKDNFIGYPFIRDFGGYSYVDTEHHRDFKLGLKDGHPNAAGHEHIAEMYYEQYKKIYL